MTGILYSAYTITQILNNPVYRNLGKHTIQRNNFSKENVSFKLGMYKK